MSELIGSLLKDTEINTRTTRKVGDFGEKIATDYLIRNGFKIITANFKAPIGRNRKGVAVTGEIDIIALEKDRLCFIEVKTRSSDRFASPLSAVDLRKQRQITRTSRVYRKTFDLNDLSVRFDVISIILNGKKAPKIELTKGFWKETKFKKKFWSDQF